MKRNYHTDNKSVIVYKDWEEYLKLLPDEETGRLFRALLAFASRGEDTAFEGASQMLFAVMKVTVDRDGKAWEKSCEARAAGGKARAAKAANATDTDTDTDNDTDTVTDTDTVPPAAQAARQEGRTRSLSETRSKSGSRSADKNKNKYDPNKPSYDLEKLVEYALYNTPVLKIRPTETKNDN